MLSEGEGGYSDGWLDRLPPNGSLGTEAVDMSIDYPLEGTKHPPRPFHLSSFPLLPLSLWCRRLIWMLPASHFSMSLALAWRRLLHHARARSYVRLKCQNEWSGDQPDIPTLNDPHFTTGAPRENPNWARIAN